MLKKATLAAALCALAVPFAALATGPSGFGAQERPGAPQGFTLQKMDSIAQLKKEAHDDQLVTLQGRFTKQLSKEKFEFTDVKGDKIVAELDDDQNWSQVHKDALMEIVAEVDKDFVSIELDVIDAKRLQ